VAFVAGETPDPTRLADAANSIAMAQHLMLTWVHHNFK